MLTVLRKELRAMTTSSQTWAMATAYVIISGIFFVALFFSRPFPDLQRYYSNIETTLVVLAPIVAMRSFAEERRTGVLDITLSWPVSRWALVLGKYLANTIYTWVVVSIAWLYVYLIDQLGNMEIGKAASGFLGILMLSAMFNALALAVSARAASPTTAAFVGFGLLLGLWILDFVPGWVGGDLAELVEYLAPTTHIVRSGRGVLDLGDSLYFLAGCAAGVTLAAWALREPRLGGLRSVLRGRYIGAASGVAVVLVSGIASTSATGQLDLTPNQRFTLTAQSEQVLRQIERSIHIYGLVEPGSAQQVQMRSLVDMYQAIKDDVELEFVDPDAQPARVIALGATTYGEMVIEIDDRREVINDIIEIDLTSAIQRVGRVQPPLACFTVGHGERAIDDQRPWGYLSFAARLQELGYETVSLALGAAGGAERLARCSVVIVGGPQVLFEPAELQLLQDHARADGRLVVLAEAGYPEATAQINDLIRPWGLTIRPASVRDRSSLLDDSGAIVAFKYPSDSPVTTDLSRRNIPLLLVGAQPVESALLGLESEEAAWLTPLVQSSSASSIAHDDGAGASDDSIEGPFVLGAITDWSRVQVGTEDDPEIARTRIGVVGTAEVAANQFIGRFGNTAFSTNLVSWIAIENDIIAASRDPGGVQRIALTQSNRNELIREAIVIPALIPLLVCVAMILRVRRG